MAGALWLALTITVVASTSCSIGKALQKEATRQLPRFSADRKILQQYLLSRLWLAGLAADLGGGVLQVFAFALAPVSVVQPVSGVGLVGLAVYSHLFLKERLHSWEWAAVALAGLGTLGLGATSGGDAAAGAGPGAGPVRMLGVLALMAAAVSGVSLYRQQQQHRARQRKPGDRSGPALYGLQAGACFGLSAASCRVGFLLGARHPLWVALGLAGSVGLSGSGFVLQTCGLKEGSTVVVCTCAAVSSMVSGVLVGLLGLGEALPGARGAAAARLASWAAILAGVAALANGAGGARELAAAALARVPQAAWRALPLGVAMRAKGWATHRVELPELHVPDAAGGGAGAVLSPRL